MNAADYTCARFETALSEYRDGTLGPAEETAARRHVLGCSGCAALLAGVNQALERLAELPAVDPSPAWMRTVLAQTSGATARPHRLLTWWQTVSAPRFAMSVAMSVFAVSLVLNAADVNLRQLSWSQFTPSRLAAGIERDADRLRARGLTYLDDLRVVYQIEAMVQQMRQNQPQPGPPPGPGGGGHTESLPDMPQAPSAPNSATVGVASEL